MNPKQKDCVFGIVLLIIGAYATIESALMIRQAAGPPYRVDTFGISPGMLPLILGIFLLFFSFLLLVSSVAGSENAPGMLADHARNIGRGVVSAFADHDFRIRLAGIALMFGLCFLVLGEIPFWLAGSLYLFLTFLFLRPAASETGFPSALDIVRLAAISVVTVAAILVLFEKLFKTTLP
ncbi:MAG: tripartite tricarboxylate transporter TctB family protein [Planctomycetota bacterium]|nr:tripartite tricarboxylate transporter TctB family protein [Planctomycetota bacterium]